MDEIPASVADWKPIPDPEHTLTVAFYHLELMAEILSYIYTTLVPLLDEFGPIHNSMILKRPFREKYGPIVTARLNRLFRELPSLEEIRKNRARMQTQSGRPLWEAEELIASFGGLIGPYPTIHGKGLGIGWGPSPDFRNIGRSVRGNVCINGKRYPYGNQFGFWSTSSRDEMLHGIPEEVERHISVFEWVLDKEAQSPLYIVLTPASEHHNHQANLGCHASIGIDEKTKQFGALHFPRYDDAADCVARHQGQPMELDEYKRRCYNLGPDDLPLRFLLESGN